MTDIHTALDRLRVRLNVILLIEKSMQRIITVVQDARPTVLRNCDNAQHGLLY